VESTHVGWTFTRLFASVSLLSTDGQLFTLAGLGTLSSLAPVNAVAALATVVAQTRPSSLRGSNYDRSGRYHCCAGSWHAVGATAAGTVAGAV